MAQSRALGLYQRVIGLLGIVLLLYTRSNIKSGTADLWGLFSYNSRSTSGAEVSREDSGCFFWFAILFQSLIGLGMVVYSDKIEEVLGIGPLWSLKDLGL